MERCGQDSRNIFISDIVCIYCKEEKYVQVFLNCVYSHAKINLINNGFQVTTILNYLGKIEIMFFQKS